MPKKPTTNQVKVTLVTRRLQVFHDTAGFYRSGNIETTESCVPVHGGYYVRRSKATVNKNQLEVGLRRSFLVMSLTASKISKHEA